MANFFHYKNKKKKKKKRKALSSQLVRGLFRAIAYRGPPRQTNHRRFHFLGYVGTI